MGQNLSKWANWNSAPENEEIPKNPTFSGVILSGAEGSRTLDLCIANAALSQLSYDPIIKCFAVPYIVV
jgi:hypothetical protein